MTLGKPLRSLQASVPLCVKYSRAPCSGNVRQWIGDKESPPRLRTWCSSIQKEPARNSAACPSPNFQAARNPAWSKPGFLYQRWFCLLDHVWRLLVVMLVVTTRASSGWRPVMLLNIPQYTGRPTAELSSLADVSPAPVLPPYLQLGRCLATQHGHEAWEEVTGGALGRPLPPHWKG